MDPLAIYEDLKQKIIWLDLSPGCTLNLAELAGRYGVSRNPVMIALARLDAEQWVVRHGVHFVVSPLTVDRMREITEIRSLLEPQATIWAMNRMTAEGLEELRKIREEILSINIQASKKQIVEIDFRFHQLIFLNACSATTCGSGWRAPKPSNRPLFSAKPWRSFGRLNPEIRSGSRQLRAHTSRCLWTKSWDFDFLSKEEPSWKSYTGRNAKTRK
jgi:DNA-binding GntR family transcriptional regulator